MTDSPLTISGSVVVRSVRDRSLGCVLRVTASRDLYEDHGGERCAHLGRLPSLARLSVRGLRAAARDG